MNKILITCLLALLTSTQIYAAGSHTHLMKIAEGKWTISIDKTREYLNNAKANDSEQSVNDFEAMIEAGLPVWSVEGGVINHEKGVYEHLNNLNYKILSDIEENYYLATGPSVDYPVGFVVGKIIEYSNNHIDIGIQKSWKSGYDNDFQFILYLVRYEKQSSP